MLRREGIERISSRALADRFDLSASQIRKDLAHFGEFGIRGVGYDVALLESRLAAVIGLEREHPVIIVGAGNIGSALAGFQGLDAGRFRAVAIVDRAPRQIGRRCGELTVEDSADLSAIVHRTGAEIGVLAVPAIAAQANYEALVAAGVRAVLNFAPVQIRERGGVRAKSVDLLIFLEELAFFLDP